MSDAVQVYAEAFVVGVLAHAACGSTHELADVADACEKRAHFPRTGVRFFFCSRSADYFAARREAEEAYVRSLQKLTKRSFLSDTTYLPVEYKPVYDRLVAELAEAAHAHTTLERRILRDCEEPLRAAPNHGEWAKIKRHDETLAPIMKEINALESQLAKDQKKFDSKKTGAAQAKVTNTQQSLARAVGQWDRHAPLVAGAYERMDRGRLTMLRDAARQLARVQCDFAKETYDMARNTGHTAQSFDPEREVLAFAHKMRPAPRSGALRGAPSAPSEPSEAPHQVPRMPSRTSMRRTSLPQLRRTHDEPIVPPTRDQATSSPRFSVPLPSALFHTSQPRASEMAPVQETPDEGPVEAPPSAPFARESTASPFSREMRGSPQAFDQAPYNRAQSPWEPSQPADENSRAADGARMPSDAGMHFATRRATTQFSDVPLPDANQDEAAAWEHMRMQLRNSSIGVPSPPSGRRDRSEYRKTSYDLLEGASPREEAWAPHAPLSPPPIAAAAEAPASVPAPAPPLASAFSPATISTTQMSPVAHAVPLSARIVERVNVMWVGSALTRVMVVGEVRLSILAGAVDGGRARIALSNADQLEKVAAHPDLVYEVVGAPDLYEVDLAELAKSGSDTVALRYQLRASDARAAPLLLEPKWRCEAQQSSLLVTYRVNNASLLAERAPHAALSGVHFSVAIPPETPVVGSVLSQPVGDWDPDAQQLAWQRAASLPLGDGEAHKILARFPVAAQGTPQPVSVAWQLTAHTVSDVGLEARAGAHPIVFASVHRETVAGKYFAQP